MYIKKLKDCEHFIAGDDSLLREYLHPDKESLDIRYSLARAVVAPGTVTKLHKLKTSEVYYIISGKGLMHVGEESSEVGPDDLVYIPPEATQYVVNTGYTDLVFLCIVDPAWKPRNEEIL